MKNELDNIPAELRGREQWVLWREETRDGKLTKVPCKPNGDHAKANDSRTWCDFETAREAARSADFDGAGFVFTEEDPFVGIDLDDCIEDGELTEAARRIVEGLQSYTEHSPSRMGVHILCKGSLGGSRNRTGKPPGMEHFEMYEDGRYFTVTGWQLDQSPSTVQERPEQLDKLYRWAFDSRGKEPTPPPEQQAEEPCTLSDPELLEQIRTSDQGKKFERLWTGNIEDYDSQSEADLALCSILAFWTDNDPERIDALFRKSNLYRDKWERDDYRERTISTATDGTETYGGAKQVTGNGQSGGAVAARKSDAATQKSSDEHSETRNGGQSDGSGGKGATPNGGGDNQKKQADRIRELASDVEIHQTPEGKFYASFVVNEHRETWPADSDRFEMHLMHLFLGAEGKTPNAQAVKDATQMLKAEVLYDQNTTAIHTRVGRGDDGALYIDLCDEEWRAVRVTGEEWEIVSRPPVRFRRPRAMKPLPLPETDGAIETLRPLVNVEGQDWRLVVAWLLAALRPEGPYPPLVLQGEQGSAKSTLARFLRGLVDPCAAPLRNPSRNQRELMISARNTHVIAFDNVSGLSSWLSDALCSLSTGGGFATRELHTDTEEIIFDATRPTILTGIENVATRDDLAERALTLTLGAIGESDRQTERELNRRFEAAAPKILGGLLDALVVAERRIDEVELQGAPRMADFVEYVVAAEPALPWAEGDFQRAYNKNRATTVLDNIHTNPLARGIVQLMEGLSSNRWRGKPSELKDRLDSIVPESDQSADLYPGNASWLTQRLKRVKPMLRKTGIEIENGKTNGKRYIDIVAQTNEGVEYAVTAGTARQEEASVVVEGQNESGGNDSDADTDVEARDGIERVADQEPPF